MIQATTCRFANYPDDPEKRKILDEYLQRKKEGYYNKHRVEMDLHSVAHF